MKIDDFTAPFTEKSFTDRLKDTGYLIKNSFTIIGKDKDIKTPLIRMILFTTTVRLTLFIAILVFFTSDDLSSPWFPILSVLYVMALIAIIVPIGFFYDIRQKANQSWIVYNTMCGKDISFQDAVDHTKSEKGKLRIIGLVDLVLSYSKIGRNENNFLINMAFGFLEEVWDLLNHYMLPAIVIEQKKLEDIVPDLKTLKQNVPATLTGVFGLDFAGDVIRNLLFGFYFVAIVLSVGLGWLLGTATDFGTITFGGNAGFAICWIPVYITVLIAVLISGVVKKTIACIKAIYFTIFYTSIQQPENIVEDMKEELTHYLLVGEKADPQ